VRDAHVHELLLEKSSNAARKKANLAQLEIDLNSIVYKMWAQETLLKVTLMALLMKSIHKYDNM
jgi:hypothetical protein